MTQISLIVYIFRVNPWNPVLVNKMLDTRLNSFPPLIFYSRCNVIPPSTMITCPVEYGKSPRTSAATALPMSSG